MDIPLNSYPNLGAAFAAATQRHGDRIAVMCGTESWTYSEFAELTVTLSRGLTALAGPDRDQGMVAVLLDRSMEFAATVIATVTAGMTYVPIDPQAPPRYIADLLDQIRPAVVVATGQRIPGSADAAHWVSVAQLSATASTQSSTAPNVKDPAYVIFTSGSTGSPKGVVLSHRSMLNSTQARMLAYGRPERIPLLHSPGFDVASGVVFYALLCGGTLVVNPAPMADVAATVELVRREGITHLVYAASLYPVFLERVSTDPPPALTAVMIGSERWSEVLIGRHARFLGQACLYNEYGPTEACVWSSYAQVYHADTGSRSPLTIGEPLLGTGYHLLDADGSVVEPAPGVVGELAITGPNIAVGYLARPELTAERFIELPDGTPAFRTGDLVEYTESGQYVFRGRGDRQVKIGGNRIELGHIETALMTHPGVEQAHVCVREDLGADITLVAYLVPTCGGTVALEAAREHVAARLPLYMIPTAWASLAVLPRTINGKIDERALPHPGPRPPAAGLAPVDPVEQALVAMLADVAGVPEVPVTADLGELGLGSLAYVRLSAAISQRFDVEIPMSVLFAVADVREIAARVREAVPTGWPALVVTDRALDAAPLSAQQRQIWILHHLAPDALAYTTQCTLELTGEVDVVALERALTRVVGRHEIMATTFHEGPQGPVQRVHAPWPVRIELVDLTALDAQAQRQALEQRKRAAMGGGFDIAVLPLVRWQLYRLASGRWELFQVEHHMVHDGWSATLLLAEIRDAYAAELDIQPYPHPPLPVQYRDYARWHQLWRTSEHYQRQRRYWAATLDGCSPVGVSFEPDRPRPPRQSFTGGCVRLGLTAQTMAAIDAACARHGVTRFAVFLSAFALLVWRHTNETDMVIGSALANRRQPGTAPLLGMFVNALPLRLRIEDSATVGVVVDETMRILLGAQDHQEFPFVDLVETLALPRDPSRNALFSLMFAFHDSPRPRFELPGLRGELHIDHNGSAKNEVNVVCVPRPIESGGGIEVLWEYNSDLFDEATAQSHAGQFAHIVAALADHWDIPITDLDLLGPAMTRRLLAAGTGPDSSPAFATVPAGIEASIARIPDAVAVIHGSRSLTYRDLDLLTIEFEDVLDQIGLGTGATIAIGYGRSPELIAAWLAVLRRGGTYLTVDPAQPQTRLLALLSTSFAAAVLCAPKSVAVFGGCGVPVIGLDSAQFDVVELVPPRPPLYPDAAAYLTFTSGSTGTPKAVVATHANAVAAIHARTVEFGWTPPRTLITLPPIFDVAASMTWWTLWLGGTVILPGDDTSEADPDAIRTLIDAHAITHVNFVASFYAAMLSSIEIPWPSSLRVVAVGGEPCTSAVVRQHAELLADTALYNEYGPTEATVWCSAARVHPPTPPADGGRVTIGGPIANAAMFVLNARGQLAPIGARGELVIAGAGVAAGYLDQPEMTGCRFVPLSIPSMEGRRGYRTGDAARMRASGDFEFLGRDDDQVKVRGFRIDTGEVTACLSAHPAADAVFVTTQPTPGVDPRLVAFVAASGRSPELAERLREWAGDRLPGYMVPSVFVILEALPLTAIGKPDRGRMPFPAVTADNPQPLGVIDDSVVDRLLRIWRTVLGRNDIGVDSGFFASGGDSLQAIQAAARARAAGVNISVADLLSAPSVRALDRLIVGRPDSGIPVMTQRRPRGATIALTPIQEWFFAQQFTDPDHFHQARLFEIGDDCELDVLRTALAWVVDRHDAFRTQFTRCGDTWIAVLDEKPTMGLLLEHTLPDDPRPLTERLDTTLRELHRLIDIASGRTAVFALVRDIASARNWLYLIAHHLIIDAVSWQILTDDIEYAYRAPREGRALPDGSAPGMPTQAVPEPERDGHWESLVRAAKPVLSGGGAGQAADAGHRIRVSRRLSYRAALYLRHDVRRLHDISAQAVLLAALHRALALHSDRPDLYVWLEGHGRTSAGTSDLANVVGWLTCLYPILLTAPDTQHARLADTAIAIDRQLGDVPDAGTGFGRARYQNADSPLGRQLRTLVPPQITFNYLGGHQQAPRPHVLRPVAVPDAATIGAANVLPTPLDVTVAPDMDGSLTCYFSVDPGLLTVLETAQIADRFAGEIEDAARMVPLTTAPAAPPARTVFMIHPVGGLIDWYTPLARALGDGWECYGLPHDHTCTNTTMAALARQYLSQIRAAKPSGAFTLIGWCMGGPLAYEIARQAHDDGDGDRIEDVIVIDPPRAEQPTDADNALIAHVQTAVPHQTRTTISAALAATTHLPLPDRAATLVDILGPGGPGTHDYSLLGQLRMRLSCHAAMSAWQPRGQIPRVGLYLPEVVTPGTEDAAETWRVLGASVTAATVPGDHESILTAGELHHAIAIRST
ncbi:non-ribosomal peptide synthetase [Nocardia brasiliensis]|uniref:non-ribosomal peptide synthetase n=1 Tax=Nocardia brasiliensis TaxID=37326 RepID=UPI00245389AA|nr:non-ribosomal peptide synthetase [Nocardia brasiliensis]